MPESINPPAIVKSHDAEMEQLAFEATSALEAGAKAARTTLERYREAGAALIKAKDRCKHGCWLAWLKKANISPRTAQKAIRVSENWAKCALGAHLNEALSILAAPGEEKEKEEGPVVMLCERCQRVGKQVNCKACAELVTRPPPTKSSSSTSNNGHVVYDWKSTWNKYGYIARQPDVIAKSYPGEKESVEYKKCYTLLSQVTETMKAWQKRLTEGKK